MRTRILSISTACAVWAIACSAPPQSGNSAPTSSLPTGGWIDATATLDPATTPVYEGDAPMKFDFLKDMRRGDPLTLSAYSMGAHSGTHVDAPMHFVRDGASIEQLSLDRVFEMTDKLARSADDIEHMG